MTSLKTPRDKYMNDPQYHSLVDQLEYMIEHAHFTPSELREACVLASINYEMRHTREMRIDPRVEGALQILDEFVSKNRRRP